MGRPKKYTPEFIAEEAKLLLDYAINASPFPFKEEFAIKREYPSEYLSRWAKENDEFSQALKRLEDLQRLALIKALVSKKGNTAGIIFTLKNVAGWRDRQNTEHSFDDGTKRLLRGALAKLDKQDK